MHAGEAGASQARIALDVDLNEPQEEEAAPEDDPGFDLNVTPSSDSSEDGGE